LRHHTTTDISRYENHSIEPPTFIKTNEFTFAFQEIVNTYGVPRYKEVNPAIFVMVTFPFLFGVMFGDIGHGFMLLVVGILLVTFNDRIKKSPLALASKIRYLVLLMGIFSFFNGFIYNEYFAIPLDLFGSCYSRDPSKLYKEDEKIYGYKRI
jgi:V-type H+-transporting ATPase subunit a